MPLTRLFHLAFRYSESNLAAQLDVIEQEEVASQNQNEQSYRLQS